MSLYSGGIKRAENFLNFPPDYISTINDLPNEVVMLILNDVSYFSIGKCLQVSKTIQKIMEDVIKNDAFFMKKAVFRDFAAGPLLWNKVFKQSLISNEEIKKAFESLTCDIHDILNLRSKAFPEKTIGESYILFYIPEAILDKKLNLESFSELLKDKNQFPIDPYGHRTNTLSKPDTTRVIKQGWVLMTKEILPESRGQMYWTQIQQISKLGTLLNEHQVPDMGAVAVGLYMEYFRSEKRYLNQTLTRCVETGYLSQVVVGMLTTYGLQFDHNVTRDFNRNKKLGMVGFIRL